MNSLVEIFGGIIRSWAGGDRIRISPTQGRLLGLQPGDRLVMRNEVYRVRTRVEKSDKVFYELDDSQQMCQLVVSIESTNDSAFGAMTSGQLHCARACERVFDEDVVVLAADD